MKKTEALISGLRSGGQTYLVWALTLAVWLLITPSASAQSALSSTQIRISRATGPIGIDGELSDDAWRTATRVETWYEINPGDNTEPKVRNVGYLTYDDRYFYAGFEFEDPNPSDIRAPLGDRDNIGNGFYDYGGLVLDTRNTGRTAFDFAVTPRNIQYDGSVDDGKRLDAITNEDIQRLKHHLRERAPKTVNNVLTVLSVLLKKAVEWDVIERLPCTIRLVRISKPSMGFYDFDEYESLIEAARTTGPVPHLIGLLGGEAGLRCGEMIALEWGDVDLGKRQLCIQRSEWRGHVTVPKGGRLRYVPMTGRLAKALQEHRHLKSKRVLCQDDTSPLTQDIVGDHVRRAGRKAGVGVSGAHRLRHTFCSHLAMKGAPARAIQELAGHQDLITTQRYMHLSAAAIEGAIRLLEQPMPPAAWRNTGDGRAATR
jgi:integrase